MFNKRELNHRYAKLNPRSVSILDPIKTHLAKQ